MDEHCPGCGSVNIREIAVVSREPHGEQFYEEGYECDNCGLRFETPAAGPEELWQHK